MGTAFDRAVKECERWGVTVLFRKTAPLGMRHRKSFGVEFYSEAPQNHAWICLRSCAIWWGTDSMSPLDASGLLHELFHVVVWRECGEYMNIVDELDSMLALEHEANRRVRASWSSWMHDYGLGSELGWGDASTFERHKYLKRAYLSAEKQGLMRGGKPTYLQKYRLVPVGGLDRTPEMKREAICSL